MKIAQGFVLAAIVFLLILITDLALADEVNFEHEITTDSDGNDTRLFTGGYSRKAGHYIYGINSGVFTASDTLKSVSLNKVQGTFKRLSKGVQVNGTVHNYFGSNWSTFGGTINVSSKLGKGNVSASAEKNIVDSVNAINSKITFTSIGVAGDYNTSFLDTTLVGAYTTQNFSDGNVKDITKLKVIVPIKYGLSAQALLKIKDASFNPKEYFSPEHLQDELIGVGYRKKYSNKWYVDSKLMVGTQQINSADKSPEVTFKVLVRNNINKDLQVQFLYDLLDIGGIYPYKWELYGVKLKYTF